jgi:predicted nucleotidyltransferase
VDGFEVVDPRYRGLYERAAAVLGRDPRVLRIEPGGSIAQGTADRWSDLDLTVVAHVDAHAALLDEWARPLFPRYGLEWPDELASVVAIRLDDCLGVDAHRWLH